MISGKKEKGSKRKKSHRMNFRQKLLVLLIFYDAMNISTTASASPSDCCCCFSFISLFLSSIIFLRASSLALAASDTLEGAAAAAAVLLLLSPFLAFFEVAGVTFRARGWGATPLDFGFGSGAWKKNRNLKTSLLRKLGQEKKVARYLCDLV